MPTFDDLSWQSLDAPRPEWQHLPPDITGPTFKHIGERVTPLHALKRATFYNVEKIAFTRFGLERDRQSFIGRLETTFSDAMGALADSLKTLGLGLTRFGGNVALQGAKLALIGGLIFGGAHIASPPAPAHAATITVDDPDGDLINVNNLCSLSEAIINANDDAATHTDCAAGSGPDTIVFGGFAPGVGVTFDAISGPAYTGAPEITSNIIIDGGSRSIDRDAGGPQFRLFQISNTGSLTLDYTIVRYGDVGGNNGGNILNFGDLTLRNSAVVSDGVAYNGGGIFNDGGTVTVTDSTIEDSSALNSGGGIFNDGGTVDVNASTISDNFADYDGGGIFNDGGTVTLTNASAVSSNTANFDGGGIYNDGGTLNVTDSAISNNTADFSGGGIDNNGGTIDVNTSTISGNTVNLNGGGIFNSRGTVDVNTSTISGNTADVGVGGGIVSYLGTVTLMDLAISANTANLDGGGIYNRNSTVTLTDSTVSGNVANADGGGIYTYVSTLDVLNSTIAGNTADEGGGIFAYGSNTTVTHVTLAGNTANDNGNAIYVYNPGASDQYSAYLEANSTIFGNPASAVADCYLPTAILSGDGLSLISETDASCDPLPNQGTMDLGTFLLPLADNGGPTLTRALVDDPANPALDRGTAATSALVNDVDQRLLPRIGPSAPADIGAFEIQRDPVELPPPGQPGTTPVQPEDLGVEQLPATGESPFWTRIIRFVLGLGQ